MKEDLQRRISAALDAPGGLDADPQLRALLERDPDAAAYARDLERLGRALRSWPVPSPGDAALEALATRIEQRLEEVLPRIADPTAPPEFDDDDAFRDAPAGLVGLGSATSLASRDDDLAERPRLVAVSGMAPASIGDRLSIPNVPAPPIPKIDASAPVRRGRRALGWVTGLAAAAVVGLGVFATVTLHRGGDMLAPAQRATGDGYPTGASAERAPPPAPGAEPGLSAAVTAAEPVLPLGAPLEQGAGAPAPIAPAASAAAGSVSVAEGSQPDRAWREGARAAAPAELPRPMRGDLAIGGAERFLDEEDGGRRARHSVTRRSRAGMRAEMGAIPALQASSEATGTTLPARGSSYGSGGGGGAPGASAPAEAPVRDLVADLPAQPERGAVLAAIQAIEPAVRACGGEQHGVVTVRIAVAPSGRVTTATVIGAFAGTPVGSCVARAVRGARFPPFSGDRFEITYPFQL